MSRVKGGKISSKLAFVRDRYGESKVAEVLDSMTAGDQQALAMVLDTEWYPLEPTTGLFDQSFRQLEQEMRQYTKCWERTPLNRHTRVFIKFFVAKTRLTW
jgi:hypothetical protein